MKNSNDTIGNRTRDLPACSAVNEPTAPPRAPTRASDMGKGLELLSTSQVLVTLTAKVRVANGLDFCFSI